MMIHNFPVACCMLCFVLGIINILQPAAAELWPIILLLLYVLYIFGDTRHYLRNIYTISTQYLQDIYLCCAPITLSTLPLRRLKLCSLHLTLLVRAWCSALCPSLHASHV